MKTFQADLKCTFRERPNRFVVTAGCNGKYVTAHCPNPGRLTEILIPGTEIILEKSDKPDRKTPYTLVAASYKNKIIPLYSARANTIARELIIPVLFPQAESVTPEYSVGNSRFDFLIITRDRRILLEVKACTLCEYGTAMFPDAPTLRGARHVQELSELTENQKKSDKKTEGHVLFIIMHGDARRFIPNIHTDPEFGLTLSDHRQNVEYHAVSVRCDEQGETSLVNPSIPVLLGHVRLAEENRGCYLLIVKICHEKEISIGALGSRTFDPGYYVYTGSAMKNLQQRISRHLRARKKMRWHIDYLRKEADSVEVFPVYTKHDLECSLAGELDQMCDASVPNFGSGDCSCRSHLFFFRENPLSTDSFITLLLRVRHHDAFASDLFTC